MQKELDQEIWFNTKRNKFKKTREEIKSKCKKKYLSKNIGKKYRLDKQNEDIFSK